MKLSLLCIFLTATGRCASQCPGQSTVHTASDGPTWCQVSEDCMSATCYMRTATHPSPSADSVTLKLTPCSTPIWLTISGDLQDGSIGALPEIQVEGLVQVPINQGGLIAGLLQVTKWIVTDNTLHFGMEVNSIGSDAVFNVTLAQHCTAAEVDSDHNSSTGDSSLEEKDTPVQETHTSMQETADSNHSGSTGDSSLEETDTPVQETDTSVQETADFSTLSPSPSLPQPLTTCEALQAIARSTNMCEMGPNTCQALECIVEDYYRIGVTISPCGKIPGVMIVVDHLPGENTLLQRVFTGTRQETIYLGDSSRLLFDMVVSIDQALNMDHITLMLELIFPRGEVSIVLPTTDIPVDRSSCSVLYTNLDTPGRTSFQQTAPPSATTSEQPDILSDLQEQPTGVGGSVPASFKIVLASVIVTTVLLVAVVAVVICSIVLHRKLDKHYAKLDKRLII